jgi:succinate dehydrogenase/fumarate reductase flavoprotein subunit
MNRNTLRMAAVSAVAAIALGGSAGLAQASEGRTTAPQIVSTAQQAEAQQAARALLEGPLAPSLTDAERTEMMKIASGEAAGASKWSAIRAALSKIGGFGKAIGGKFSDFQKWWDGLKWWQKLPVTAISPTLTAVEIWNALH